MTTRDVMKFWVCMAGMLAAMALGALGALL